MILSHTWAGKVSARGGPEHKLSGIVPEHSLELVPASWEENPAALQSLVIPYHPQKHQA